MKKSIVTLIFIGYFFPLFASHIIGGSMTYEHLQGNEYKIRLEVLRDCFNGQAPFDNPATIGVFDESNQLLSTHLIDLDPNTIETISVLEESNICELPLPICVERAFYELTLVIPQKATLVYQRCCRSLTLSNIVEPGDVGMSFTATIDPALDNNSVIFNNEIPAGVFVGVPFVYDASVTDLDGDSLVYELATPIQGGMPNDPQPQTPSSPPYDEVLFLEPNYSVNNMLGGDYPLTINAQTGEMSAIPVTIGSFQVAYKIHEYRDGEHINTVTREFTFSVVPPPMDLSFDVSGQVFVDDDMQLDKGWVRLLERDVTTDSLMIVEEQLLDENGAYAFENVEPGVFYIKAYIDPSSIYYDQYIPTYYGGSPFWYEAENMNQCDTSQQYRDIYLLTGMELFTDESIGCVILDTEDYEPMPNVDLILTTLDGNLIQARTTDEDGAFKFENLEELQEYHILVDLINSKIDNINNPAFVIAPMDINSWVGFLYDTYLEFDIIENDSEEETINQQMQLFPNPNNGLVHFNLKTESMEHLEIIVHDLLGKKVASFPIPSSSERLNVTHLSDGLYNFSLFENGQFLEKKRLLILKN